MTPRLEIFDWTFLDEVGRWALGVAVLASVVGTVVVRSWTFPLACMLTVAIDVALVHASAVRGGRLADDGEVDHPAVAVFFGGRLAYKALLMGAALLLPGLLDFWGVVTGALVFDTTLLVVGSILAVGRLNAVGR